MRSSNLYTYYFGWLLSSILLLERTTIQCVDVHGSKLIRRIRGQQLLEHVLVFRLGEPVFTHASQVKNGGASGLLDAQSLLFLPLLVCP